MDTSKITTYIDNPFSREKVSNRRKISEVHYHPNNHELYYLINGTTKYFVGDEIFVMNKGSFIFIPMGVLHKTDSEECMYNERILFSFDNSIFDETNMYLLDELTNTKLSCIPEKKLHRLEEIISLTEKEYQREDKYSKNMQKLYLNELITLICRYRQPSPPAVNESDKIIFEISDYIRKNYDKNISLKELSKRFAMSESHLSRKFKNVSGTGVNEYITYVRIANAESLLKQKKYTVSEIAYKCGFNDSNYFSTVFRRIKGLSPIKFANKSE